MRSIIVGLVLCSALPGCRADRPTPADEAEIRAVLDRQRDAWNRGDIRGFMEGYLDRPDIVFTSGATVRRGWDQTLAAYQKRYVASDAMGHLEFEDVELQPVGRDGAVALGRFVLTETPEASEGIFSLVFFRAEGRWAIVHDHTSTAVPPA